MRVSTRLSLRRIAAFLPVFSARDFQFALPIEPVSQQGNVITFLGVSYNPEVYRFLEVLSQTSLTNLPPNLHLGEWGESEEAQSLFNDRTALDGATPDQLGRLLTLLMHRERIYEGTLLHAHETGLLTGILRQAAVLAAEGEASA